MYNRTQTALGAFFLLLLSAVSSHAADGATPQAGQAPIPANPWDSSTWMKHHGGKMRLNLAHPSTWLVFLDPKTHTIGHLAFTNPANYAQFAQPRFWMQFANPNNWMAWINPGSYAIMFDPATYTGWMRPEPWMHFIDPGMYTQLMNPSAYASFMNPGLYMKWVSPSAYALPPGGSPGDVSVSKWLVPNTWIQNLGPGTTPQPPGGPAAK